MAYYDGDRYKEISRGVNLLEYVSKYIHFKKKGKDYFGRCPLHVDTIPSFSITPSCNSFYCFSCGRGGGIIQYLVEFEHLDYNRAIKKAEELANIKPHTMCQSKTVRINKEIKNQTMQVANRKEHKILDKSFYETYRIGKVKEWLEEGIRQEEIELFEIRLDDKSHRIVYPVYDVNDNFINIKGRTRVENYKRWGISKYINYYPVGTMDYFQGLNITRPSIEQTKEIKIVESLKSVMKLYGHKIRDSVSAEKHDLTSAQIEWIIRSDVKNVVLCYDSDITYKEKSVVKNINTLKRFVNVYLMKDEKGLLGGREARCAPIDLGIDVWNQLYEGRSKVL